VGGLIARHTSKRQNQKRWHVVTRRARAGGVYLADMCGFKTKSKSAPHIASIATVSAKMITLCLDIQSTDKPGHSTPATSPITAMTQIADVTATTASMLFSFHMHHTLGANQDVRQHMPRYISV